MAEILLSAFLPVLFEKLASLGWDYVQRKRKPPPESGISTELLNEWKNKLDTIYAVLDDAEDNQPSGKGLVKQWLDEVRELAYDMEDLLDEFAIQDVEVKSAAKSSTSRGQVNWKFSCFGQYKSCGSNLNLPSLVSETKVQEINGRLEKIITRKDSLRLTENVASRFDYTNKRLPSTSLSKTEFFGREKEEEEIVKLLIGEAKDGDTTLCVVPIVGMGGIGKTALAQRLYNDARVCSYFEKRAWVCVSDTFDVPNITKTIFQSVTRLSGNDKDFNKLQVDLKDNLSGKKFLVVLDDVWKVDYEKWTTLLTPFEAGAKGSKIIVTSRIHKVVPEKGASSYNLEVLSLDNCTSLIAIHALGATNFEGHPYLETIGKKIAEKCKGLPLAAKMLGGALCNEKNLEKWEAILNNKIWDLKGKKDEVLPVLRLSYVHLPSYLKKCFAYCAVFPKDYEIERDEMVLLWIAEGFFDGQKEEEDILRVGRDHFDELVFRSFLQPSRVNTSKFLMHDLLNDLAKSIAGVTCFSSGESQLAGNKDDASLEKARHASFISSRFVTSQCLRAYHRMKVLRSLMLLHIGSRGDSFSISNKVLDDLLTELKYLRVFSLCHCSIIEVPDCVGDLKHLRYLNFSYTNIKKLPESIVGLCKLQALILRGCQNLSTLPPDITNMDSLQFLDIRDTGNLKEMPLGISNMKNLIVLSKFVVGLEIGSQLKELKNLLHLQGELFISELQKVEKVGDVVDANLFGKGGLSNLSLHWSEDFGNPRNKEHEERVLHYLRPHTNLGNLRNDKHESRVLNSLRPHTNLESLTISDYRGAIFPSWLDGQSYSKIVSLCLWDCPNVTSLPSLGQLPSLRELSLEGIHAVSKIDSEFYGSKRPFSSLTTLKFQEMLAWKDWSCYVGGLEEEVPFPRLQHLVVRSCPSLVGTLPCQLDRLIKLEIHSCPHLNNLTGKVCLPSLRELYLEDCSKEILKSLVNLNSLTILKIEKVVELVCFDHGFMRRLDKLKELHIGWCEELSYLWQDGNEMLNLTCLHKLTIANCPLFTSFVAGGGEIELPCSLETMNLSYCTSLEKLPSKMRTLRNLSIQYCPKLRGVTIPPNDPSSSNNTTCQLKCEPISFSFAKGVESLEEFTAESLESLTINFCENLGSLPQCLHRLSHLTHLNISECSASELEDFPPLPITLSSLELSYCQKIKSIANCNIASCKNLTKLFISNCPALEIEDFPSLPISLSSLTLWDCPKIKSLPNQWHHLTSLHDLDITSCESIICFPKGDLPPNLQSLHILMCKNLKQPVREWGLPLLASLKELTIDFCMGGEGEKVCFPSEEEEEEDAWSLLFPSSLTALWLYSMRKVERLSSGLCDHLSSLQWLLIADCPELTHLPEDGLPPSLQDLRIFTCPKLRYLPKDGLPPSLQELLIKGCEILKDRCLEPNGDYWPRIQEIPRIRIL